jgi:transcriptional regulator NrdR family protein
MTCPNCGTTRSRVYRTLGNIRYRKCLACKGNYRTQEVSQESADMFTVILSAVEALPDYAEIKARTNYLMNKVEELHHLQQVG